jgi:hypothetical protein
LELTGEYLWQALGEGDCWRDVHPEWHEPIFRALASGAEQIQLVYEWRNSDGETVSDWYTISFKDRTRVFQTHNRTGTQRPLRAVQWVTPTGTYVPRSSVRNLDSPPVFLPHLQDGPGELPVGLWL